MNNIIERFYLAYDLSLKIYLFLIGMFVFKVYHTWRMSTNQRRTDLEKGLRANYHYRIHLQRVCFNAWITYAEYRRRKNIHKSKKIEFSMKDSVFCLERVHEYYQRHLTERIYSNWKQALARKLLIQQNEHRLAQLQKRVLIRWAFEQWKSCAKFPSKYFFLLMNLFRYE